VNDPIAARYHALREQIEEELRVCGRRPGSVRLLGVSKLQPVEKLILAAHAGLDACGENYVQEAKAKFAVLGDFKLERHFIGHLQTNKAKVAAELFDVIQSVDRLDAAIAIATAAAKLEKTVRVLVQVNVSPSERFGATPEEARRIAEAVLDSPHLQLDGVMAIGPITQDSAEITAAFSLAAKTFEAIGGTILSMGMSGDWHEAIRAGSTMVRIGTALFGERPYARA
jgi:pyridoxal phosphate enzyme (YggS family)